MTSSWVIPKKGRRYSRRFFDAEYMFDLPPRLLARVAKQESNYNANAQSSAGAKGLMQIVQRWHPNLADPFDAVESIDYAAEFLRKLHDRFGTWSKALAAYNAGPTALASVIRKHKSNWLAHMPAETQAYVANITHDLRII